MDMQKLVDTLNAAGKESRSNYHLTLGELIDFLSLNMADSDALVMIDNGSNVGDFDSYRGYYSDLAIEPGNKPITVGNLLAEAQSALDAEFTGYKGGEFVMSANTPIWVSHYGQCSGIAAVGIEREGTGFVIRTKLID